MSDRESPVRGTPYAQVKRRARYLVDGLSNAGRRAVLLLALEAAPQCAGLPPEGPL